MADSFSLPEGRSLEPAIVKFFAVHFGTCQLLPAFVLGSLFAFIMTHPEVRPLAVEGLVVALS